MKFMIYELREYDAMPGQLQALLNRFEAVVLPLWKIHEINPIGFWTGVIGESVNVRLHYIIAWKSLAEREEKMNKFGVDPKWISERETSEVNGPLVAKVSSQILKPTSFSRIQ